ncbi:alpha/beta-hydrolase [Schizopora paradoxa]|uniref:Alpha/beta-hydrolase n=1 Tax=Schizopora paradoxa TaxID=27342 RepID=A0A0H2RET7_9AGAM|nr:alpha/beta-hydrolase [Schizopora paradoxa]
MVSSNVLFAFFFALVSLLFVADLVAARPTTSRRNLAKRAAISQSLLEDFVRYTNYSSGAYLSACPSPLGNTLVLQFSDVATNTQGHIARDDSRQEIVVAYRGSLQLQDFLTDADFAQTQFSTPGLSSGQVNGVFVHQGFLVALNSVASLVTSAVAQQLDEHPNYTLIATGHSLGSALASLGAVSLAANFPGHPMKLYTFGQPRTGNPAYAALAESLIGVENIFRAVHTTDIVPLVPPQILGYQHHATQYWNFADPSVTTNVKECSGGEDPTCSDSVVLGTIPAHLEYFGQALGVGSVSSVCGE